MSRVVSRSTWGVSLLMIALTAAMTWPLSLQLTRSLPGDYGDPVFVTWAMGWVAGEVTRALAHPTSLGEIWNANIFYPERGTLAFSEHFIGQTILVLPVYWLTHNLILIYNVAFFASFVLTGLGTFMLARALTGSNTAGIAAGVIAAFNPYRLAFEVSHLHVLSIQWLPFGLYALHRYLETDLRRYLVAAALALIALNLSSIYYMAYCAPFILIFVFSEMVRSGRWSMLRVWFELWATAACVVVVTMPFLLPYMEVQQRLGIERPLEEVVRFSATLDQYRMAGPGLWPAAVLAAVGIIGVANDRTPRLRWAIGVSLVLAVLAFWLSLGPIIQSGGQAQDFPGLYRVFYDYVPGYRGLRVPARFAALLFIFAAIVAGAGVAVWERRWQMITRVLSVVSLALFVNRSWPQPMPLNQPLPPTVQGVTSPPAYLTPNPTLPDIYRAVDALQPGAIIAELPLGDPWYDLRYMYFAATHRRRLLNGYSGIFPPSFLARQKVLVLPMQDPDRAAQALGGATHVVVHRAAWPDNTGALVGAWLESRGARVLVDHDGAVLYELPVREELAKTAAAAASPR